MQAIKAEKLKKKGKERKKSSEDCPYCFTHKKRRYKTGCNVLNVNSFVKYTQVTAMHASGNGFNVGMCGNGYVEKS